MAHPSGTSGFDIHKHYTLFIEIGLIVALLVFIVAMRADLPTSGDTVDLSNEKEAVTLKHIPRTTQEQRNKPVTPNTPIVEVAEPSNETIDDPIIDNNPDPSNSFETLPVPAKVDTPDENIFMAVEHQPELIGGLKNLQKQVEYPSSCKRANIEGRVTLQFVVNKKGEVEDITVLRGIGGGCDKAAVKAVKEHAKFKPGLQRGEPVNVQYSLPVFFKLQ